MNRKMLAAVVGILVAAGGAVLIWQLSRPSETPAISITKPTPVTPAAMADAAPAPTGVAVPANRPRPVDVAVAPGDEVREVKRGDMVIHDHRDNPTAATDPTPVLSPPGGRLLPPSVTNDLAAVIRPGIAKCVDAVASGDRGAKARVDAHLTVVIKAGKLAVNSVEAPAIGDIKDGPAASLRDCIKAELAAATMATSEADIENYPISISMPLTK
jgi:hypothetical protein